MGRKRFTNNVEKAMVRNLDTLAAFEEYSTELLPLLRKAISEGWTADQIENHPQIKSALVARQISIALKDPNATAALSAIKDLRDRVGGKAIERRELKVALENASDEDLDAKLAQLIGDDEESESEGDQLQ